MSLELVLAIVALVLAITSGVMSRGSTPSLLLCTAVALVAVNQILGGGLIVR